MTGSVLHIFEFTLWIFLAGSVGYIFFFSLAALFYKSRIAVTSPLSIGDTYFLILIPAYREDGVIRQTVISILAQDYPTDNYQLAVISDHMSAETNEWLAQQPLLLLQPSFQESSKGKALQFAIQEISMEKQLEASSHIVILDADNIVLPDFLRRLSDVCQQGFQVIQCHRTAKNNDNDIAALDGISEEINNTLFRRAHNAVGLSSALIGSGMCFPYVWFASHVSHLSTAVEDRELEALLMREGIYIHYAEDILVMDEKVSSKDNFQRQRLRWMTGQVQSFLSMLPFLPKAFLSGNINYIDKTLQQALIPRSILLFLLPVLTLLVTIIDKHWSVKWWVLLVAFCLSLFIAIPKQLRSRALVGKIVVLPSLVWRMTKNLFHIDRNDTTFHHTEHHTK